ncbi:rhomboid family intramembrane serine protease [Pararhodobacter sp.]|uniref:rhomboid family intramembrane serine protease n=1 Tax=Pararhodobacter sp. TaxID=2127056 RepID=UPI002FDDB095
MQDRDQENTPDGLHDLNASPLNPLPGAVWLVSAVMAGVELVLWAGGAGLIGGPQALGWRLAAIERFGFSSAVQGWMLETARYPVSHLWRYPAFGLIHAGPLHAFFVVVLVAALGKYVAEAFGARAFLVVLALPPMLGAVVFGLAVGDDAQGWLLGGMPMVFGLVGALTWWRWQSAGDAAGRRRAFALIGVLLAARLGFGLLAETGQGWVAEIAAFGFGFALAALVGPGGWAQVRARLRHR